MFFVVLFYSSASSTLKANLYVSVISFNINDIVSGTVSACMLFIEIEKFWRINKVVPSWGTIFRNYDVTDGEECSNETKIC